MKIIKPRLTRYSLYRQNMAHSFRDEPVRYGLSRSLVFLTGSLSNLMYRYEIITAPLIDDTYKFKVVSQDNMGNVNEGVEVSGTVTKKLWYPTLFRITGVVGNVVTFAWAAPAGGRTPTHYVIYGNGGSGYAIDRITPVAVISSGTWLASITLASGIWLFVIESRDGTGETVNNYAISQTLPVAARLPYNVNDPGDQPIYPMGVAYPEVQLKSVQLRNVSVGKCEISFLLVNVGNTKYFRIYHDSGTGTINWTTYAYRFEKIATVKQTFTTDRLFTTDEDKAYKFGIRAESADGVVEQNLIEYDVTIDGKAPAEVQELTAGAV